MINLIQLLTDQRAYEGITHSQWGASWNWQWRFVGDDKERRSPSLEPQTDSRSALPRKNRAWRRLRIIKRNESFSLNFSLRTRIYRVGVEVGGATGGPRGRGRTQGVRRAPTLVARVWPPWPLSFASIFYYFQKYAPWSFRSF